MLDWRAGGARGALPRTVQKAKEILAVCDAYKSREYVVLQVEADGDEVTLSIGAEADLFTWKDVLFWVPTAELVTPA